MPTRVDIGEPGGSDSRATDVTLQVGLRWLGVVVGQATVVGALFFYFGWVRTQSLLVHFGLDNNIVSQSWNDYVLRSPNVVVRALTLSGVVTVLLILVAHATSRYRQDRAVVRRLLPLVGYSLSGVTLVLGLLGYFNIVIYSGTFPFVPLLIGSSFGLLVLAASVADSARGSRRAVLGPPLMATVVLVILLCLFWTASVYATTVGHNLAEDIERRPDQRPRVTVFSVDDLGITAPVTATHLEGGKYAVRYTGLRLLIYAAPHYYLLPDGWRRGTDPVYVLRHDTSVRVEIVK